MVVLSAVCVEMEPGSVKATNKIIHTVFSITYLTIRDQPFNQISPNAPQKDYCGQKLISVFII